MMFGAEITLDDDIRKDSLYFGENQSRIIVSLEEKYYETLKTICDFYGIKCTYIGRVGGDSLTINNDINVDIDLIYKAYYNTISEIMNKIK